jgi:amino acid transporter
MSQVNIASVKKLTSDSSYIGIIITVVVAVVILIVAFFMNIVKWALMLIAVMLFVTVGIRVYKKFKDIKQN